MSRATTERPLRRRLDQLVVERGLAETRAKAQALILAGQVRTGEGDAVRTDRKAGDLIDAAVPISVAARGPWVSRGGHKLAAALDAFGLDPSGLVCLDAGASTGGFTDVLLQRGANRVHAVDVGRGQLADRIARDPRVVVHDRTNARNLQAGSLGEPIDLAAIDVSFISLALVLGPVASTLRNPAQSPGSPIVALVKPQFEVGKGGTDHGVVRDAAVHADVLRRVVDQARALGLGARAIIASPILGPEGNREFLVHLQAGPGCADIEAEIQAATARLGERGDTP
ncbi:MAG TPA: TlyA family RNA methyltransferase [Candidatus Limnocylindrales bacterium]|nr:TlyA family RNA methyltransferase [Candidatus Limnocylindrales bacterium]